MLCLRLAHALKIPVPSGGVIEKDGELYFASLVFFLAEETLPKPTSSDIQAIVTDDTCWRKKASVAIIPPQEQDQTRCEEKRQRRWFRYGGICSGAAAGGLAVAGAPCVVVATAAWASAREDTGSRKMAERP
jgi:hypothetical protein